MNDHTPFLIPGQDKIFGRWPEGALVYHIYPRSFQDSNNDGIGDLPGIISRLDHLQDLHVTALWLSPFYPSPMADFGYDVSDYCDVNPLFGTLDDFKSLMKEAAARDIKVMIDLVPNHTSDEHIWFQESAKSADTTNPFRDWYVWRDPVYRDGSDQPSPPNNWRDALTGGTAWQWSESRQQYYLHSFDVRQPDLNWSNPAVREAMRAVMRFWLDLGVDGFRVDAVYWMAKEPLMSDDPVDPEYVEGEDLPYHALKHDNSRGWPAVYAYLSEMAEVLHEDRYKDKQRFMVTEAYPEGHNPLVEYLNFYVGMDPQVAAPFNFEALELPWEAGAWRRFLRAFHSALHQIDPHCVPSYAFGNHDKPRIASRIGAEAARSAAVLLLTLPGMAFLYYGDEIGMKDVVIPRDQVQDPAAKGEPGLELGYGQGRDPQRTPMQWSSGQSAGFSTTDETWLPVAPDYQEQNVEAQQTDPNSLLNLYKKLSGLRAGSDAIKYGTITVLDVSSQHVLGFIRRPAADHKNADGMSYITLINFSDQAVECAATFSQGYQLGRVVVSTHENYPLEQASSSSEDAGDSPRSASTAKIVLRPHEAAVYELA
ncbi:MAG TPA: alpha-amylase family glycosyl hydrolase [Candidatus Saccharimonadales bacterium]